MTFSGGIVNNKCICDVLWIKYMPRYEFLEQRQGLRDGAIDRIYPRFVWRQFFWIDDRIVSVHHQQHKTKQSRIAAFRD